MGYRERNAHKQQQKQQSLGQGYQAEQRVGVPAPQSMNLRDNSDSLPLNVAVNIVDAVPDEDGLLFIRKRQDRVYFASTSNGFIGGLVSYIGSGSSSAELWAIGKGGGTAKIWNVGEVIDGGTTATASAISAPSSIGGSFAGDYIDFNKTVIFVTGTQNFKWTRASAWELWSASVSAGSAQEIHAMWGITKFKNRIFTWKPNSTIFYYSSVDQIIGNLNAFDLGGVLKSNISIIDSLTRDGGSGPDDFLVVIGEDGDTAVYQGTDPGDASNWSLVGVYQIGQPLSKNSHVKYGQQLVVLCEDDFYFLPEDLAGKRRSTPYAHRSNPNPNGRKYLEAVFWKERGKLFFSDGGVIDPMRDFSYTTIAVSSASPYSLQELFNNPQQIRSLALYKGKLYSSLETPETDINCSIQELLPTGGSSHIGGKVVSGNLKASGRSNISLVNPRFQTRNKFSSTSAGAASNIKYRTAVIYDTYADRAVDASANAWVTTSASANSYGVWVPGFGTGDNAQLVVELLTTSTSSDVIFRGFDFTYSDTGGL